MNDLATWVPHGVLFLVACGLATAVWALLKAKAETLVKNVEAMGKDVAAVRIELLAIDKKLGGFATIEALGRMGDRFDARCQAMLERIIILEQTVAVLKAEKGRSKR